MNASFTFEGHMRNMDRLVAFLFWGVIATAIIFFGVVWLAGRGRDSATSIVEACTSHNTALAAAEKFHNRIGDKLGQTSIAHTGQIFLDAEDHIEVTLIFPGMRTAVYSVQSDCEVKFA